MIARPRARFAVTRSWLLGVLVTAAGVVLFVQTVRSAGIGNVLDGLRRTGAGFLLILALSGIRQVSRALAWTWCVDLPARLPLWDAFAAGVAGDALGNVTPLGLAISEPTKAVWVRPHVSLVAGGAALTIENVIYSASVVPVFVIGTLVLPFAVETTPVIRTASVAMALVSALVLATIIVLVQRKWRFLTTTLTWLADRGVLSRFIVPRLDTARQAEELIHGFTSGGARRMTVVVALEGVYHVSAIAEVWVTLTLIGLHVTLLSAFVLEYVNRVVTVAFKFMPMRLGVDEAGSGLVARLLGFGAPAGVTLAVIRKARVLCWTIFGLILLGSRTLTGFGPSRNGTA